VAEIRHGITEQPAGGKTKNPKVNPTTGRRNGIYKRIWGVRESGGMRGTVGGASRKGISR